MFAKPSQLAGVFLALASSSLYAQIQPFVAPSQAQQQSASTNSAAAAPQAAPAPAPAGVPVGPGAQAQPVAIATAMPPSAPAPAGTPPGGAPGNLQTPATAKPFVVKIPEGGLSVEMLSAIQSKEMEIDVAKRVGSIMPASSPQVASVDVLKPKKQVAAPSKPYLYSVVGVVGQEQSTWRLSNGDLVKVAAFETKQGISVGSIDGQRVQAARSDRKKKKANAFQWITPGEYLK